MYYYNIHDIIKINSNVYLQELEYFNTEKIHEPDITLDVKSFSDDPDMSKFRSGRKLITENFPPENSSYTIKYTEHFGSSGAQFKVYIKNDKIDIFINKLIATSKHVVYVNLVEPILRFLFVSKGFILLHSACMSTPNNNGFFLSAPPDTGKTTTVIKCVKNGYSFLSDDMTIIRLPNEAICFPKSMTISSHTYKTAVEAQSSSKDVDTSNKFGMRIRSIVHSKGGRSFMHKLADHNVPIFTINTIGQSKVKPPKYHIKDIIKNTKIQEKTIANFLFFLEKGEEEKIEKISIDIALKKAIENSDDAFLFPPYSDLIKYIIINGKSAKELLAEEERALKIILENIECYILKSNNRNWVNMLMEKFK
ncbi:MAG: hypothetical protein ACPKPY_04665 [Nitrososphaeraceae archaeon]